MFSCFPINLSRVQPLHDETRINAHGDKDRQSTYNPVGKVAL